MEKVYPVTGFRASEQMNLGEYFKKYRDVCPLPSKSVTENFFKIVDSVELQETTIDFEEIAARCNPDNLTIQDEPAEIPMEIPPKMYTKMKFDDCYPVTTKAKKLNVIRAKEALEKRWIANEYKFSGKRFIKNPIGKMTNLEDIRCNFNDSEYIFSIIIYKPSSIHHGQRNSAEKLRFAFEFEALGSNLLSDVVDMIECMSNSAVIKEVENTKVDLSQFQNAKKQYPSQTVFIDGVFYNDTRLPGCTDLSAQVIKWAKAKNIGKFTTAKMHETGLSKLSPRLGYPYVYLHQADCEHIFVFSDARLVQNSDSLKQGSYPKMVSFIRSSNNMCILCTTKICQWMVTNCDRFPQERVFLCTKCCNSYLYVNGEKVTGFKLYPCFDMKKMNF